nr:VWFA and cache domain-containing protein 1 isoform X1 [Parasteatoda tepidariorum]XP_042909819.1 VWFA and cache domain-containing protein 1 isoform X2 [Parasteatoda tepidariorum]
MYLLFFFFPSLLRYFEHFGSRVNLDSGCLSYPYSNLAAGSYITRNYSAAFKMNFKKVPSVLWQYLIFNDGSHFEYPSFHQSCNGNEQKSDRHRQVFQDTLKVQTKYAIIVIDQGNSLSFSQFVSAKIIGKHILGLLSSHDKVIIMGLASDIQYAQGNSCSGTTPLLATFETKLVLMRFFDSLSRKPNITDHVLAFQRIYDVIRAIDADNTSINNEILVSYISRGLLSSLTDARKVLEIISNGNQISKSHIVINTYALIDDNRPVMYEKDFLEDVAEQNYRKYNIRHKALQKIQRGVMVPVNTTKDISLTIGDIFKDFPRHMSPRILFSLPYYDPISKGMVISLSQQILPNGIMRGLTGVDISLSDIAEEISYFQNSDTFYVFLLDESGVAIAHPSFSHPTYASWHHIHTYIWHLEDKNGFEINYNAILREPSGKQVVSFNPPKKVMIKDGSLVEKVAIFSWKKIERSPYIVVVVSFEPTPPQKTLKNNIISDSVNFSYHRIDILPTSNTCRHMKQLSSLGTMGAFLSASCFVSPYNYLTEDESLLKIFSYMAYFKDPDRNLPNPGFKPGIRSEILALTQITPAWQDALHHDEFSDYIVRRFIATSSGVFLVYPATLIDKSFDPTRRDWYIRALEHPGKIILTSPYLDVGGAGYIITLSLTIFEGKPTALHTSSDNVVAVMGLDFSFGYFYKFLVEKLPVCQQDHMICFLLDDKGYLVAHPDLIDPSGRGPVEQQHITHKEPLVANDMLNHRNLVTKKICASYSDRTIQRFYQLNTSLDTILSNFVPGEQCTKYQVMHIHSTNIFLGIVNQTCDGITAFCPCSMTDRLCLNCHRMEPTECECPCECPLKLDVCSGDLDTDNNRFETCPHFPEMPNLPIVNKKLLESLKPCYDHHCESRTELSECLGILGCEWCQLESDGVTPLAEKFCTEQRRCFGGVFGSRTPYSDEIVEELPEGELLMLADSNVGPITAFCIVCLVIVIGMMYFFRKRRNSGAPHYGMSSPDNFTMAHLKNEADEVESYHEHINPVVPMCRQLIPAIEHVAFPYRVPTNYRRPAGGDSDHGYSTMTPHEDNELAPYFEPLLLERPDTLASQNSLSSDSCTSSPLSYVPSTACSMSPSVTKIELPPSKVHKKDIVVKGKGAFMLAHVQVHNENVS